MPAPDLKILAVFADSLADVSRATVREALGQARSFVTKGDASPVTAIDREVEQRLRARIEVEYPDHGILGEEFESVRLDAEWVWVIDPIDGTKAFITGIPTFGTLIALARNGVPVLGVIDNPVTSERWLGADGMPTSLNGKPVRSRTCQDLGEALVGNGNPESFDDKDTAAYKRLRRQVRWSVYGGGCHAYGRVADGALDINVDGGLDAFDYCALIPIVRNAGGVMTDWQGGELTIRSGRRSVVACATPELHRTVLGILANATSLARAAS
ncbi:inositol monophosphatase family protein [Mesorhizobium sp. BR1-1-9]|uniref:inositol monophosphatase family protein n=1 Tax=Mesorhizobium sp. BR1-1-9 TaxID=2876646 RepID=UPI001CD10777|nr:inositol monophosphatase family protein [Mesorhizobium sp. BR1-1-9]MBZ9870329.1 inositol monophosphatase family protein [Mesorhizobium sp. BR1-1-9]